MLADASSFRPNYTSQEVPLVQGTGLTHEAIGVLVDECYEALSRGHPVAEKKCTSCQIALPYEGNPHPGRYREVTKTKCVNCGAAVTYQGFHSPLGRYDPKLQQLEGTWGIFLPIKGPGLLKHVEKAPSMVKPLEKQEVGSSS